MTKEELEILKQVQSSLGTYGGGTFGTSYIDQYKNASAGIDTLNSFKGSLSSDTYGQALSGLQGMQGNAVAGGALSLIGAVPQIATSAIDLASIGDTTKYENDIKSFNNIGIGRYSGFDQLAQDYSLLDSKLQSFDKDTVRGMNGWGKASNILSSTLAGANAGMSIGGGYGAAIGAGIGLLASGTGTIIGDIKAKEKSESLKKEQKYAYNNTINRLGNQHENLLNRGFRDVIGNAAAEGGPIEKKETSLKDFYDSVRGAKNRNTVSHSAGIVREKIDGGTKVKIRIK